MANYSGHWNKGNQAINTAFKCDIVSSYHNKLLWNIFSGGVVANYTNVINCNSDGISTPSTTQTVIEWKTQNTVRYLLKQIYMLKLNYIGAMSYST